MRWILILIFVVEYSFSYGLQRLLSTSDEEKRKKLTLSNTKAMLPFAIISVISNKVFVRDTRVYMNWNETGGASVP